MEQTDELFQKLFSRIKDDSILFFDLDGTLVHTDHANLLSYIKAIQMENPSGTNLTYNPLYRINRTTLNNIIPNLSEDKYQSIVRSKEECYKNFLHETRLNHRVSNILSVYSDITRTVLVTNCREERAKLILNHHGLTDKFDDCFYRGLNKTGNKINKFLNAIDAIGISAEHIIVFENEQSEMDDAVSAGINPSNIINVNI
ncbi:HAD family hydrolase [Pedobacter sp. MC2016-24]|uniref:HAD family hydrolase n=1 Tax=Pedobacter sp. MC2016-24 TaxID=2780090 RepID=UPI00187FB780|nr:NIF family HAD-type phosphatase [Pedobacter sp. MC2016-24]MBE9597992.1 HAD family hydrolase [Pedobacter sp. MC2016-24]